MLKELIAIAPRRPMLREYQESPLQPNQIRIRSLLSCPKHGTELGLYRGISASSIKHYDPKLKLFLSGADEGYAGFPLHLGDMTVGQVTEVGAKVRKFHIGDKVFGYLPIRETHAISEEHIHCVPEGMNHHAVVYLDSAQYALGAVRDANIRLGERVALFGLGAIGFMCLEMVKLSGAELVIAIEPLEYRQKLALKHGADLVIDPTHGDVALGIKEATGNNGVDVAIEASGAYLALHEAIRCVHFGGLVVPLAAYTAEAKGLRLGEEWHMNRITMRSSRATSDPNREHPMWSGQRIRETVFRLLKEGKLSVEGLIHPIVPFEESAKAYQLIDESPGECVKLGIVYPK